MPLLTESLHYALLEKDNQRQNRLYENDILDIVRSYLNNLSNHYVLSLYFSFLQGDKPAFEKAARCNGKVLDWMEKILSTREDLSLDKAIKEIMGVKGTSPYTPEMIKQTCVNTNYTMNDIFEQLHYYYRPNIDEYIALLREKLAQGSTKVKASEVNSIFNRNQEKWLKSPTNVDKRYKFKATTVEAIQQAFKFMEKELMQTLGEAKTTQAKISGKIKERTLAEISVTEKEGKIEFKVNENIQLIEGFSAIISYENTQEKYPDFRGGTTSWWEYYRDTPEEITWKTAVCPDKKKAAFVFIASNGEDYGQAELYVNGKFALMIESGIHEDKQWQNNRGYIMFFNFKGYYVGNSGIYILVVPEDNINAGQKCEIKVSHITGGKSSWFMIKDYTDVLKVCGLN